MPTKWVVSAHAAAYTKSISGRECIELIPLPTGIELVQFIPEGDTYFDGWEAYNLLMSNPPAFTAVTTLPGYRINRGPSVPAYKIVGDKTWVDSLNLFASGIFVAGDTYHRDERTRYLVPNQWYSLKELLDNQVKSGDTIYWLACRAWFSGDRRLPSPGEPKPKPPPLPPRPLQPPPLPPRPRIGLPPGVLGSVPPGTMHPNTHNWR